MPQVTVPMDMPPYRLSGVVYGTLLNHRTALQALGASLDQPPYNGAPRAPVLYIKPRNTLVAGGAEVCVPRGETEVQVEACLGLVIGRPACRLNEATALDSVAGYVIVNDVSLPHLPYYRPSIRARARDGFCPIGPRVLPRSAVTDPDNLAIRVLVDGDLRQQASTSQLVRSVRKLLADVTEFMTLSPGDVLAVGAAAPAPLVRAGQSVRIEIDGVGCLETDFVPGAA